MEQMLGRPTPPQPTPSGSARPTPLPRADSGSDSTLLRANVHVVVTRQQAQDAMPHTHTTITPELTRVAGLPSLRSFVVQVSGARDEAALRIDEIPRELRDRTGQWRAIDISLAEGLPCADAG